MTLTIIIISLLFSAFFSGMEIAFISSNRLKIEIDKNQGVFSARILSGFARRPSRFLGAMLLGNNIALVLYGIAMAQILEDPLRTSLPGALGSDIIVLLLQTIISTLLILLVAEFMPKILFRINPNNVLSFFAIPAQLIFWVLYPVILVFIGLSELILRGVFRLRFNAESYNFTVGDLDEYVRQFTPVEEEQHEVSQEIQMFQNAIDFRSVKLRECMVPRPEITALEEGEPIETLKERFIDTGFSKILIYRESIDHIIGYAHVYDIFSQPGGIREILKPVPIFPETMLARNALAELIRQHRSLGVVVDEFGGTSGMVTLEDLMEEIFGEIADEYDVEEEVEKQLGEYEYLFSGRLEIDYLNQEYPLNLPESDEYETLAGFILHHNKSIPQPGEEIVIGPYHFTVTQASETRIEQLHLRMLSDE